MVAGPRPVKITVSRETGANRYREDRMTQDLPSGAGRLAERHPDIWNALAQLGDAVARSGPLDDNTRRLVKLALAIGARSEGGVHSHVRRALAEGISPEAIRRR